MSAFNDWAGNSFWDRVILRYGAAECIAFHDGKEAADAWMAGREPVVNIHGEMGQPMPPFYCAPSTIPGVESHWLKRSTRTTTKYVIETPRDLPPQTGTGLVSIGQEFTV
jgi:hypothetical protein